MTKVTAVESRELSSAVEKGVKKGVSSMCGSIPSPPLSSCSKDQTSPSTPNRSLKMTPSKVGTEGMARGTPGKEVREESGGTDVRGCLYRGLRNEVGKNKN